MYGRPVAPKRAVRALCLCLALCLVLFEVAPRRSLAHVVGTRPLSDPGFHNAVSVEKGSSWDEAMAHYYAGRLEDAARVLRAIAQAGGAGEGAARRSLAVVLKDMGDYRGAIQEYERIRQLSPGDAHVLMDLGFAHLAAGLHRQAEEAFRAALRIDDEETMAHFGLALALRGIGDDTGAARALTQAILIDERNAVAWEVLGKIHFDAGRYQAAATAFQTALRLDSSFLETYFDLARAYDRLGRVADAWNYYERSSRIFSSHPGVRAEVDRFIEAHRDIVLELERAASERRRPEHVKVSPVPRSATGTRVRVGLAEGYPALEFSAGAPFRLESESVFALLPAGVWNATPRGGAIEFSGPGGARASVPAGESARLVLEDDSATWIIFGLEVGQGYFWARIEDRQVRGELVVFRREAGLTLVNVLDLEEYLVAVVPSEMYASMHLEALKAQAIAARTYTLRNLGRYSSRGFDVLGSVSSSEYRGVDREHPRTTKAVTETAGKVLVHGNSLIEAFYNSSAGGYTASSEAVWGGRRAYLQDVPEWGAGEDGPVFPLLPEALEYWLKYIPDVYSSRSEIGLRSTFRWVHRVSAAEIERRIPADQKVGRILKIVPGARSRGGYLQSVTIVGTEGTHVVRGDSIRGRLGGLKSNAFKVEAVSGPDGYPESFIFYGAGYGHGVGLSQFGAAGMAEAGFTAEEILAHYFPGAVIR